MQANLPSPVGQRPSNPQNNESIQIFTPARPGQCVAVHAQAAEGRRTPKRWREFHGSRVRGASWSAPVLWRFSASARFSSIGNPHFMCQPISNPGL